jgi:ATP-dependent protease ClpP protease subunit
LIKPDINYRPNPSRAVYLDGQLDDKLLSRLTMDIIRFQSESRDPITLYVLNSPGGPIGIMQNILRILRMPCQDASAPCRLITVVTTKAQSAAADLISAGDYAIALPGSSLLYHGVRTPGLIPGLQPLTAERTSLLSHILRITNDAYAMDLAKKAEWRFMLRFVVLRSDFHVARKSQPDKSDLDCFLELLAQKLSPNARRVFKKAQERYVRYEPLFKRVTSKTRNSKKLGPEPQSQIEARVIKAIVDFELAENKQQGNWTFKQGGGLIRIVEDFFLISEYVENEQSDRIRTWCLSLGKLSLSKDEIQELDQIKDEKSREDRLVKKVQPPVKPLVMFFVALCHALQEDDNDLNATDAYWLGLVDEVMGDSSLVTSRSLAEYQEDPPEDPKT